MYAAILLGREGGGGGGEKGQFSGSIANKTPLAIPLKLLLFFFLVFFCIVLS